MTKEQPTIHVGIDVSKDKLAVAIAGGMSRTMLKSVSGDAADLMVTQPEPTGQPAH